jgi:hypothetical protein
MDQVDADVPTGDDADILQSVIGALRNLDPEARARVLQTVATFFQVGLEGASRRRGDTLEQGSTPSPSFLEDRSMQPKEFLLDKQPKTDVERVACLAYYLTHYRETPHFKTFDISKLNTEAAQPKFANAANSVNNALKRGYLVQATRGQRQLSAAGERFVQALPDRQAAKDAMALARPRRSRARRAKDAPSL